MQTNAPGESECLFAVAVWRKCRITGIILDKEVFERRFTWRLFGWIMFGIMSLFVIGVPGVGWWRNAFKYHPSTFKHVFRTFRHTRGRQQKKKKN